MKDVLKNLAALIKVKTIVTICVLAVWMSLSLSGADIPESVNNISLMVIAFYFGTQAERKSVSGGE